MRGPRSGAQPAGRLRRSELSLVALGLFALVAIMALRVQGTSLPLRVDEIGARIVDSIRLPPIASDIGRHKPTSLLRPIVGWGTLVAAGALTLSMVALAWRRHDRWAALLSLIAPVLAVALVEVVAKPLVGRWHGGALSFPSGHVTVAAAPAAAVLVLLDRWYGWRAALRWMPALAVFPVLVGVGVVRLGWHYPTDVVGGIAFGTAVVAALAAGLPAQPTPTRSTTNTRVSLGPMARPAPRLP